LREEVKKLEKLLRSKARSATPFSKGKRKAHPKRPGRKRGQGPFQRREAPPAAATAEPVEAPVTHASTFSENGLAMRAGLAALDVLERERLGERGAEAGEELRQRLTHALSGYEMVKEVRGIGMLSGIEFTAPRGMAMRLWFEAFRKIHPAMFGQILVMHLFRDKGILTQICGNNFMVLKVAPPLASPKNKSARSSMPFTMLSV
jgi:acetylornithine/succinyldiaminopimelate/putrescine aminotransferase